MTKDERIREERDREREFGWGKTKGEQDMKRNTQGMADKRTIQE